MDKQSFHAMLLSMGVIEVERQDTHHAIAKRCATDFGLVTSASLAVAGAAAGARGGLFLGTLACTAVSLQLRNQIPCLAQSLPKNDGLGQSQSEP